MRKNVVPLVIIALVVAVASTFIFYGLIVSRMDGSTATATAPHLVAARTLERGQVVKADDLQVATMPDPKVPAPQKAEDVLGRVVTEAVPQGTLITEAMLSQKSAAVAPKEIPDGMRAVTVHISDSSSVLGLLHPGDRVDVQAVIGRQRNGENDVDVKTLLQNATVFLPAVEMPPQGSVPPRSVLTLLATPQDAERLSAADAGARLRVVLRNVKDNKLVPLGNTSLLSLNSTAPKPQVTTNFTPRPVAAQRTIPAGPMEFEVSLIEVSAEQAAGLGAKSGALRVISLEGAALGKEAKSRVIASSRLVASRTGELSWKAGDDASMRVRVEALSMGDNGQALVRIQPEATQPQAGVAATRRADSSVHLNENQVAVVSGLADGDVAAKWREKLAPGTRREGGELVMVIAPAARK
jgi:Flp pilus assembly protein CpaB